MEANLALLPVESDDRHDWGYSHSVLSMDRRTDLFAKILAIPAIRDESFQFNAHLAIIPDGSFQDGYGYGRVMIKFVYGQDLIRVIQEYYSKKTDLNDQKTSAILAYLRAMPSLKLIGLRWY